MNTKDIWRGVKFFLGWRLFLGIVAAVAPLILAYRPSFPYAFTLLPQYHLPQWAYSWANFDGVHYLTIAEKGYIGTGLIQAFFPGFPGLMMLVNVVVHNTLASGLLVSNLSSLALLVTWFTFLKQETKLKSPWVGVLTLFLFPTAFFLGAVYNESLFLTTVLLSFLMARRRRWGWASLAAGIASATRIVGILLIPALILELVLQEAEKKNSSYSLASWWSASKKVAQKQKGIVVVILSSVVGLAVYMAFLTYEFHDPLYFLHVQSEFGAGRQEQLIFYPQVVWRCVKILVTYRPFDWKYFALVQEAVVGGLGLLGLLWSTRSVRWSYSLFAMGAFLVPTLTGTFSSMPRYILVCFPLFIALAGCLESRRWLRWLYLLGSTVLLVINTILFIQGYWVA